MSQNQALKFNIVSFYQFTPIPIQQLPSIKQKLLQQGQKKAIRGLILLSADGINATLTWQGEKKNYLKHIEQLTGIKNVLYKQSTSHTWSFKNLRIKIKQSIITMEKKMGKDMEKKMTASKNTPNKSEAHPKPSPPSTPPHPQALSPTESQKLLQNKNIAILDIRNYYEVDIGRFKNAKYLKDMKEFSEFPQKLKHTPLNKNQKTLIYCTGGIRCEKALKEMQKQGFKDVHLLKGGILNYLKEFPNKNFEGECFVFDKRVAINQQGQPSQKYTLCPHCGQAANQAKTCLHCKKTFKICQRCLQKKLKFLQTCSKNCTYHYQQGHQCKKTSS